jgi:SAM-dependent methyltransferase
VPEDLPEQADVWVVGQPGRKSHGLLGSAGKHLGLLPPRPMVCHTPGEALDGASYDRVAALYDATFEDIRVRGPEVDWLAERVPEEARVLDLGCGTGGLLRLLGDRSHRIGADVSGPMLAHARRRDPGSTYLQLDGPRLPLEEDTFDVVTSLLSWRYLDWDPILAEVARVLRPGGRLLVVDMVATPARPTEWPRVAKHKLREAAHSRGFPEYRAARDRLTGDAGWAQMLRYNPMRAEHEYRWFFGSRFPGSCIDVLDIGMHSRVLGIDSGPIDASWFPPQSYP